MFKYISEAEAYALWEAKVPVLNRYRNADRNSGWDQDWSAWRNMLAWDENDWLYMRIGKWEEEYRVEVE